LSLFHDGFTSALLRVASQRRWLVVCWSWRTKGAHRSGSSTPTIAANWQKISVGVNGHELPCRTTAVSLMSIMEIQVSAGPERTAARLMSLICRNAKLAATIDLGKPLRPHRANLGPTVPAVRHCRARECCRLIDPQRARSSRRFPGRAAISMLVLSPDGQRGYTANVSAGQRERAGSERSANSSERFRWQKASSVFPFRRIAAASLLMIRMLRIAVIEATRTDLELDCVSDWRMRPRQLSMGAGCLALSMSANRLHVVDLTKP